MSDGDRLVIGIEAPRLWAWGSVTKQVVAIAAARLVDEGKISWDDTVASKLPSFKDHPRREVTLRQLFQHTSGLADPEAQTPDNGVPPYLAPGRKGAGTSADATGLCAAPPSGEPGSFRYNNCDTIVAAAMLEAASGESLSALLRRTVFRPAGIRTTRLALRGEVPAFSRSRGGVELAAYGASAALVGTSADLLRLDRALMSGRLVSKAQREVLWKGEPSLGFAALGAWSFEAPLAGCKGPVKLVERRGEVDGIQVRNILAPDLGRAVVAFTPQGDFDFGEIWQGDGTSYDLASAAFCT